MPRQAIPCHAIRSIPRQFMTFSLPSRRTQRYHAHAVSPRQFITSSYAQRGNEGNKEKERERDRERKAGREVEKENTDTDSSPLCKKPKSQPVSLDSQPGCQHQSERRKMAVREKIDSTCSSSKDSTSPPRKRNLHRLGQISG